MIIEPKTGTLLAQLGQVAFSRGCIRIKVFDTPFIFRLHENQINLKGMTFRDFSKLFYSQGVKLDKIAKTGQIGDYFPRFWSVSLFLSTFSSD